MGIETILVCGVLGSGKTTAVNRLLPGIKRIGSVAGVVNDIGQVNVDAKRIALPSEDIFGYASGCVCCERREDLDRLLEQVDSSRFSHLVIEPSGAANPLDIIDAIVGNDKLFLRYVIGIVPVKFLYQINSRTSFRASIEAANVIGYSWVDGVLPDSVLDSLGASKNRVVVDDSFSYSSLSGFSPWNNSGNFSIEGHEHYKKSVRTINPSISREELFSGLTALASTGIIRSKGVVPHLGLEFDIVNGVLSVRDRVVDSSMPYIVLIDEKQLPAIAFCSNVELDFSSGANLSDLRRLFHYYMSRSSGTVPVVDGVVLSNFEAVDEAYSAGKKILQKYGDSEPLRLALFPYIQTRLDALKHLSSSSQDNKNFVGVMLGSFILQMLGVHDNIDFSALTDSVHLTRIKGICPDYMRYLSNFGERDLEWIKDSDNYSRFFVNMARNALPFVSIIDKQRAVLNMSRVYSNKPDIAKLWSDL